MPSSSVWKKRSSTIAPKGEPSHKKRRSERARQSSRRPRYLDFGSWLWESNDREEADGPDEMDEEDEYLPSDDQDIVAVVSTTMTEDACRSEEPPVSVNPPIDDQTSPIVEPSARNVNPSVQPPPPPPPPAPPPPPLADIAAQLQSFASALSKHAESDPQEVDKLKVAVQQVEEDLKTTRSESNAALHRLQMENETLKTENHVLKTKLNSNAKEAIAREEHWRAEENTWKAKYAQLRGDNDALFKEKKKVEEGSKFHLLAALDALGVSKPGWKTG